MIVSLVSEDAPGTVVDVEVDSFVPVTLLLPELFVAASLLLSLFLMLVAVLLLLFMLLLLLLFVVLFALFVLFVLLVLLFVLFVLGGDMGGLLGT